MALDLALDEERQMVQRSANDLFRRRNPSAVVRDLEASEVGYSPELYRQMAGLGWLGLTIPEVLGGHGGGVLDLLPIYEEMGRFLVPSPPLDTFVASEVLSAVGSAEQRSYLAMIAAGDEVVSLALMEPAGGFGPAAIDCSAVRRGGDYVVDGLKVLVAYAPSANHLLCAARTDEGVSLFLIDAASRGVGATRLRNLAGMPLYSVELDDVVVPATSLVGAPGGGWAPLLEAMTKGAVLQTATIVGAARSVLEMTNQYAKDRSQFGSPIGRYQAVQYMVSDILLDLHRTDLLTRQAAFRLHAGRPARREAAMAVAFGKRAAAHLHRQAHEVHAGIAFMLEHDLTLFSRRAKYWENNLGDARFWEEQVAEAMAI